jgi:hypothetical protein
VGFYYGMHIKLSHEVLLSNRQKNFFLAGLGFTPYFTQKNAQQKIYLRLTPVFKSQIIIPLAP